MRSQPTDLFWVVGSLINPGALEEEGEGEATVLGCNQLTVFFADKIDQISSGQQMSSWDKFSLALVEDVDRIVGDVKPITSRFQSCRLRGFH